MKRTFALLVAAAALGAPATAAQAITACPSTGTSRPTTVCVTVNLNGSGNTVAPTGGAGCVIVGTLHCAGFILNVGTTGVGPGDEIYVAGRRVL